MNTDKVNQALEDLSLALTENGTVTASSSISFKDNVHGKGMFWAGKDYTKQFVLTGNPDRLFSSESIDIADGKTYKVNGLDVLGAEELGASVTKSNLRTVGRLRGLVVDGSLSVNNFLYFDANSDRLGIGTEEPNAALSVAEDGIEINIGTEDFSKGFVGTFGSHDLDIKTDNETRISIAAGGNVKVSKDLKVSGKVAIGVNNPDPSVDLQVNGSIKFNNKLQTHGEEAPKSGAYSLGDIVWNSNPRQKSHIGWVCIKAGNPGIWAPFGEIS